MGDPERTDILQASTEVLPPGARRKRSLRHLVVVAGSVLGLLAALYAIDLLISQGDVPRGVTVAGVEIGGLDRTAAERKLREEIGPRLARPVAVRAGDVEAVLDPVRAGLRLDWASTLDRAGEQPVNPFTRFMSFFVTREVEVVTRAEEPQLANTLEIMRTQLDRDPVEGTIRFADGQPVAVEPRAGQHLDLAGATREVRVNWASGRLVELPVSTIAVRVTSQAVHTALDQIAKPAVSGPVVIHGDGADARLEPRTIATALSFEPSGDTLALKVDDTKVIEAAAPQLKPTERDGEDARVVFPGGRPSVTPSVDGKNVDWDLTLRPLPDVLKRAGQRELTAKYRTTPAKMTTDQANALARTVKGHLEAGVNVSPTDTDAGVIANGAPGREIGVRDNAVQRCAFRRNERRHASGTQLLHQPISARTGGDGVPGPGRLQHARG